MAIMALEGFTKYWFTPVDQKDDDQPARFELKPLNSYQLEHVLQGATITEDGLQSLHPNGIAYALKNGLKNWENIGTSNGDLKFNFSNFEVLPMVHRQGIAIELVVKAMLSEEVEKN